MLVSFILVVGQVIAALPNWLSRPSFLNPSHNNRRPEGYSSAEIPAYGSRKTNSESFPIWLQALTGLKNWPGDGPPFINTVDLSAIPDIPLRRMEQKCAPDTLSENSCAWDCDGCSEVDDILDCKQTLAQTFDDGPNPETTYLLNFLKGHPVSFFVLGTNVVKYPEIFRRQIEDGHLLGTHTWSHEFLPGLTNEQIAAQIQWSIWAMNITGGIVPRYFRPPYGAIDSRVRAIARLFGLHVVLWSLDSQDWRINSEGLPKKVVLANLKKWQAESQTGILLQHDLTKEAINVARSAGHFTRNSTVAECIEEQWYQ